MVKEKHFYQIAKGSSTVRRQPGWRVYVYPKVRDFWRRWWRGRRRQLNFQFFLRSAI